MALRLWTHLWTHLRCEGSEGSEGSKGSEGKVLKMDGPSAQGFLSLTALQAEGCGGVFAAVLKKGGRISSGESPVVKVLS